MSPSIFKSTAVALAALPCIVSAQSSCPGIHVTVLNLKSSTGSVACALFDSPEGFPADYLSMATNVAVMKIRMGQARCDFQDIPPGNYALAVIHDENMNGKFDMNWLGIPSEGYGFSNDARGLVGPPSFAAASFAYGGRNIELTVGLRY